jgi:hypothetical protein
MRVSTIVSAVRFRAGYERAEINVGIESPNQAKGSRVFSGRRTRGNNTPRHDNGTTRAAAPAVWFAVARYRPFVITPWSRPRGSAPL